MIWRPKIEDAIEKFGLYEFDIYHFESGMDFLKNEAPLWKKQKTQHGDGWISSRKSDLAAINKWK